jgi:hypothetical protein
MQTFHAVGGAQQAEDRTFINFGLDTLDRIPLTNHVRNGFLFLACMVKLQDPYITLAAGFAGMRCKVIQNVFTGSLFSFSYLFQVALPGFTFKVLIVVYFPAFLTNIIPLPKGVELPRFRG